MNLHLISHELLLERARALAHGGKADAALWSVYLREIERRMLHLELGSASLAEFVRKEFPGCAEDSLALAGIAASPPVRPRRRKSLAGASRAASTLVAIS